MSKNYVQDGKTIPLANTGTEEILSGTPVVIGTVIGVAITDIAPGQTGDGFAEGVFLLPKLPADAISAGAKVYLKAGAIQLVATDAVAAGVAWESAAAGVSVVDVKLNG
jgi:predicted RecA/RadA family phage recombinase